ncbi:uncharacterized protein Dsimw501_GD28188 [Drosophila simulans]|uniref:Uncharacterized protein n=1 Tax=Drosophila simulans TaxID=7240 RepID=A0A0J9R1C3_DROSI|nr:uncharacterized protein Dsimw501_GD28188 [Drosophila simulans]
MFLFSVLDLNAETRRQRRSRFESYELFVLSYDDARYISIPISRPSYSVQFSFQIRSGTGLRFSDLRYQRAGAWELLWGYRESRVAASAFGQICHLQGAMNTSKRGFCKQQQLIEIYWESL